MMVAFILKIGTTIVGGVYFEMVVLLYFGRLNNSGVYFRIRGATIFRVSK